MTIEVNITPATVKEICKAGLLTEEELKQYLLQRFENTVLEECLEAQYINTGLSSRRMHY